MSITSKTQEHAPGHRDRMRRRVLEVLPQFSNLEDCRPQARRYVMVAAAIAAVGGLLFGYDTGIIASALIYVTCGSGESLEEHGSTRHRSGSTSLSA